MSHYLAFIDEGLAVAKSHDPQRQIEFGQRASERMDTTWNPVLRNAVPFMAAKSLRMLECIPGAWSLLRAVVQIERARGSDGRVPPASITLPLDAASGGSPIRYRPSADGFGYHAYSVGTNGNDDGGRFTDPRWPCKLDNGQPDDLVLQREPAK
jgi:hypothetical protein